MPGARPLQITHANNTHAAAHNSLCPTTLAIASVCTGCAGCVIACPHDVIGYQHETGHYRPFHLEEELGPGDFKRWPHFALEIEDV